MNARGWIARVRAAAKGLAARLRRQPRPAMVGIPPSARKIPAIPADPAEHAVQFAHTWAGRLEHHVEGRMHALDIPEHQVGVKFPRFAVPADTFRLQLVRHASGKARSRAGIVSGAAPHTTSADGNGALCSPSLNRSRPRRKYTVARPATCLCQYAVSGRAGSNATTVRARPSWTS